MRVAVDQEDRHFHNERTIPSSSFFHLLWLSMTSYGMEYPFGWFRSAALGMFLSPIFFFTPPQPAVSGGGVRGSPDAVPVLLSSRHNTGVIPVLF